ncbi:MAG: hypothetical protein HWD85_01125, partial [Flavobacteriaceae bacterium]|nr:hypothetical protein [Flavobacteriaceae bacterium]
MKKHIINTIVTCLVVLFSVQQLSAQKGGIGGGGGGTITISGSNNVYQNDTKTYTATPSSGLSIYQSLWSVTGGTIQSQSTTSVTIVWTTTGNQTITFEATQTNQGYMQENYAVTVSALVAPPTPNTPIIASQNCSSATLTSNGNPPSGVTWYWQGTNSSGTSTSYHGTGNYTASSTGTYYIRARNNTSGLWSAGSASVSVTLGIIGGTTWYADYDGDGKGDPNDSVVQCGQPANFVSNSNDLCPNDNSSNSNGCSSPISLSNENYVYNITPQVAVTSIPSNVNTNNDYLKTITYFDGLGRVKQSIAIRQSPTQKDIITHSEYNSLGQLEKEYLPYVPTTTGSDGLFRTNALTSTNSFYNTATYQNTTNPYSQKTIEASP